MKTVQKYYRKGFIKPIVLNDILWLLLCSGLYCLTCKLFIYDNWTEAWYNTLWFASFILIVLVIPMYFNFVKTDTDKKVISVWIYPYTYKKINLSDIAAIHIRYSWKDIHNVILTLKDGNHLRLSIADAKGFAEQVKAIAPDIEVHIE